MFSTLFALLSPTLTRIPAILTNRNGNRWGCRRSGQSEARDVGRVERATVPLDIAPGLSGPGLVPLSRLPTHEVSVRFRTGPPYLIWTHHSNGNSSCSGSRCLGAGGFTSWPVCQTLAFHTLQGDGSALGIVDAKLGAGVLAEIKFGQVAIKVVLINVLVHAD